MTLAFAPIAMPGRSGGRIALLVELALIAAVIGVVLGMGRWLDDPEHFPVRVGHVEGEFAHLDGKDLEDRVNRHLTGSFFGVDLEEIYGAVGDLPWVKSVALRREWPDTLWIEIEEQEPVAHWRGDALLNTEAQVFRPETLDDGLDGLPVLSGPEGRAAAVWQRFRRYREMVAPVGLEVTSVKEDVRRAVTVYLANGTHLRLGRKAQAERLGRFVKAYPEALAGRIERVKQVDLRYPNGFSVAWSTAGQANESGE